MSDEAPKTEKNFEPPPATPDYFSNENLDKPPEKTPPADSEEPF
jgi:hypothetical protein